MNNNLIFENDLAYYCLLISIGVILGITRHYLIKNNNTENLNINTDTINNNNLENILNENMDNISESDFDTDTTSDYQSTFGSDSDSDSSIGFDDILNDPDLDLFFMPNVDFNVCPIQELKFFEFSSLYARELVEHSISDEEIMEFISWFTDEQLCTNWINDLFHYVITLL